MGATVRITGIEIDNFKNVRHGELSFDNTRKDYKASLLALYGQNGSGKTALIDALGFLQVILRGEQAGSKLADCVNALYGTATIKYRFSVISEHGDTYDVRYRVSLGRELVEPSSGVDGYKTRVFDEVLSCSLKGTEKSFKMQTVIDARDEPIFGPTSKYRTLLGKEKELEFDLAVSKRMAAKESRSFVFSTELLNAVRDNDEHDKELFFLLDALVHYGRNDLFVVNTVNSEFIGLGALPFNIRFDLGEKGHTAGSIMIPLDDAGDIPAFAYDIAQVAVENINVVLTQIVPGLTIGLRNLGKHLMPDNIEGVRVQLVSRRADVEIPFRCESEGIKKIVSILQLLIAVYNQPSITVAIDELDSGIFEYLLGEMLRIISEGGQGQLIFTSHNLRPMETLDKGFVAFTTTNPDNRYIRFTKVKPNNNLRDFYYRDIILGEQSEPVYEETSSGEIAYAFAMAGSADGA